jgi:hypothetical protein
MVCSCVTCKKPLSFGSHRSVSGGMTNGGELVGRRIASFRPGEMSQHFSLEGDGDRAGGADWGLHNASTICAWRFLVVAVPGPGCSAAWGRRASNSEGEWTSKLMRRFAGELAGRFRRRPRGSTGASSWWSS